MKRLFILFIMAIIVATSTVYAAEDQLVCNNSYMFTDNEAMYLLKFTSSNPELPCTSGIVDLYWPGNKKTYNFTISSKGFITSVGLGKFILDNSTLYFLDSTSIVFSLY